MNRRLLLAGLVLLGIWATPAAAHPLAPALLELRQTAPGQYAVLWRLSALQPTGAVPAPVLPERCRPTTPRQAGLADGQAYEARWTVDCGSGLAGARLAVSGLADSGINAILRVRDGDGRLVQDLVDAGDPGFVVPRPADTGSIFQRYLMLGAEHLAFGADHLLFLLALTLLVPGPRRLAWALTAFTLGHSLTLAVATLGWLRLNPMLMELGIALSLVWIARELLTARSSPLGRRPGLMVFGFGLLHGLGFAGALADAGLPPGEIPAALLAFNIGIELAQLAAVAAAWPLLVLLRSHDRRMSLAAGAPAYLIGGFAVLLCFDRVGVLVAVPTL